MSINASIRQRGFRQWYERELIRGHSHLVLLLLCAVAVIGSLEVYSEGRGATRLLMVVSLLVSAGLGVWAMRRYLFHLARAEGLAHQAACPSCHAYGRWVIESHAEATEGDGNVRLDVCCKACQQRWTLRW